MSSATPNIPNHLVFDGSNDSISLGTSLNAQTDIVFTTWVRPDSTDRDEVIFSYGDANFHGLTLTTNRLVIGDMNFKNYDATVLASNPAMYHKMNMASGATSIDETSNNHNALQSNSSNIISQVAGVVPDLDDSAAEFRGNGHMNVNGVAALLGQQLGQLKHGSTILFLTIETIVITTIVGVRSYVPGVLTIKGLLVLIIVTMLCCSDQEIQGDFYLVVILLRTYLKAGITLL